MSSDPAEKTKMAQLDQHNNNNIKVPPTNHHHQEDSSDDDHSYVSEPDEAQKRYAALRNHQIRFCDAIDPNAERVYQITDIDIVLGRGRGFQNHSGNRRMRDIIENYKTRYHSLSRMEKRKLVQLVYEKVIEGGARFLKKLDGEPAWVVVDLPIALQKVSHTMRCRKSIHKQLDANGHVPVGVGGPQAPPPSYIPKKPATPVTLLPTGIPTHLRGIPRIVSSGTRDPRVRASPLGVPSAPISSLGGLPTQGALGSLGGLGGFPPSLNELEAQHFAAQRRFRSIAGMNAEMRRQQIIRETQMYTRMGDAILMNNPGSSNPLGASTAGLLPPQMHHHHHAGLPQPTPLTPAELELAQRMSPNAQLMLAPSPLVGGPASSAARLPTMNQLVGESATSHR